MIKPITVLEVQRESRIYQLHLDPTSQLGEIYDAINEMRSFILGKIKEYNENTQKQVAQDKPSEQTQQSTVDPLPVPLPDVTT